jgi:hypothetical protein
MVTADLPAFDRSWFIRVSKLNAASYFSGLLTPMTIGSTANAFTGKTAAMIMLHARTTEMLTNTQVNHEILFELSIISNIRILPQVSALSDTTDFY